jgi:hypothetical protein
MISTGLKPEDSTIATTAIIQHQETRHPFRAPAMIQTVAHRCPLNLEGARYWLQRIMRALWRSPSRHLDSPYWVTWDLIAAIHPHLISAEARPGGVNPRLLSQLRKVGAWACGTRFRTVRPA